jgi:hypothetical protein
MAERILHTDVPRWTPDKIFQIGKPVEIPHGLVPVYHRTGRNSLEYIRNHGLRPKDTSADPFVAFMDSFSPHPLQRKDSVFANPVLYPRYGFSGDGAFIFTLPFAPDGFNVYDAGLVTDARIKYRAGDLSGAKESALLYWECKVPLTEFLALPAENRDGISFPEILLPGVSPEELQLTHIRTYNA